MRVYIVTAIVFNVFGGVYVAVYFFGFREGYEVEVVLEDSIGRVVDFFDVIVEGFYIGIGIVILGVFVGFLICR